MGLPTNWHTLITASAFSWHGKVRMAAEGLLPPRPPTADDESISSSALPTLARVYRLPLAMPQLEVGHLDRMAAIERRLTTLPGVFVSASGFRGVGLPDCIADAHTTAERVAGYLHASATR